MIYSLGVDFIEAIMMCIKREASKQQCAEVLEQLMDLYERALNSEDKVVFIQDEMFEYDPELEEVLEERHEKAIRILAERYGLGIPMLESLINDYFEIVDGYDEEGDFV